MISNFDMDYRARNGKWHPLQTVTTEHEAMTTLRHWARRGYPVRWRKDNERQPLPQEIKAMYPPPKTTEFLVERKIAGRWYPVGKAETFKAAGEMLRHYLAQGDQVRWSKNGQELPLTRGGRKHDHR